MASPPQGGTSSRQGGGASPQLVTGPLQGVYGGAKTRPVTRSMSRVFSAHHQSHHHTKASPTAHHRSSAPSTALSFSTKSPSPASVANTTGGGLIRCYCHAFLRNQNEQLVECTVCRNWLHLQCIATGEPITSQIIAEFVCQFCAPVVSLKKRTRGAGNYVPNSSDGVGSSGGDATGSANTTSMAAIPKLQPKIAEVYDQRPKEATEYESFIAKLQMIIKHRGFTLVEFSTTPMTDKDLSECMDCCRSAIEDATFSASYPRYCLREQQLQVHQYVRGCALRHNSTNKIVSIVLSNGMDPYSNLKQTIAQLKKCKKASGLASLLPAQSQQAANATATASAGISSSSNNIENGNSNWEGAGSSRELEILERFSELGDVSDFVHYTLVATREDFRRQSLATLLLSIDMLRWAIRGRTRCFVNMALQKRLEGSRVICFVSAASRNLYHLFGFHDVFPKYERTGEVRWTAKEADAGRVMANLDFISCVLLVVRNHFNI